MTQCSRFIAYLEMVMNLLDLNKKQYAFHDLKNKSYIRSCTNIILLGNIIINNNNKSLLTICLKTILLYSRNLVCDFTIVELRWCGIKWFHNCVHIIIWSKTFFA